MMVISLTINLHEGLSAAVKCSIPPTPPVNLKIPCPQTQYQTGSIYTAIIGGLVWGGTLQFLLRILLLGFLDKLLSSLIMLILIKGVPY
jgi:hypothetical protein